MTAMPMQYWVVDGELEELSEIPESDKFIKNLQWHCPSCGEIWARAIFIDRPQIKSKWDIISSHPCPKCGGGSLLNHYTLSRLRTIPIPPRIYEREFHRELRLYYAGWPHLADPYYMDERIE